MPSGRFAFSGKNKAAQKVAARQAGKVITRITKETREAIRNVIVRAINEGIPPFEAARTIKELIGLSAPSAQAVLNYQKMLIDGGMSFERVTRLVDKYADQKLTERSRAIARTETMDALNEGALESWKQAQDEGLLSEKATKEILLGPDPCPDICEPLEGMRFDLDEDFPSGDSAPPFHPNCVCSIVVNP